MLKLDRGQHRDAGADRAHGIIAAAYARFPDDGVWPLVLEPEQGGEEQELERPDAVILRTRLVESEDGGAVALECISGDQVGADGETFTHIEQVGRGETPDAQSRRLDRRHDEARG